MADRSSLGGISADSLTFQLTALAAAQGENDRLAWIAANAVGVPLGSAYLTLPSSATTGRPARLDVVVHPAERCRGIGSALLTTATRAAHLEGCAELRASVVVGSPGALFATGRGFVRVSTLVFTRLALSQVDTSALSAEATSDRSGYRLVTWTGLVPDSLMTSFVASRRAMDDMPGNDPDHPPSWSSDAVRAAAAAVHDRGEYLHTVAVLDDSTAQIVGFTELVVPHDHRGDAQHYGTGVLPEHRGQGLARWMKAAAIVDAVARYPRLAGLLTDTALDNHPMRRVNEQLGYVETQRIDETTLLLTPSVTEDTDRADCAQ